MADMKLRILAVAQNESSCASLVDMGHDVVWVTSEALKPQSWFDLVLNEKQMEGHFDQPLNEAQKKAAAKRMDIKALANLNLMDPSGSLFKELRGYFMEDVPRFLGQMKAAIGKNELKKFSRVAHTLKSTCLNIGASRMGEISAWLESGEETNADRLQAWLVELNRLFLEVTEVLKNHEAA